MWPGLYLIIGVVVGFFLGRHSWQKSGRLLLLDARQLFGGVAT
jgi:hypothetical protein